MTARPLRTAAKEIVSADARLGRALAERRHSAAARALRAVAKLGDQPPLRLLCGALVAAGVLTANRRLASAGLRALAAHELATLIKAPIKDRVDRTRPRSAGSTKRAKPRLGVSRDKEQRSFPSGHAAGSAAVARAIAREYPDQGPLAVAAAGAICAGRIAHSDHFLSDVGAGALLGLAAEKATDLAWHAAGLGDRPGETQPG